MITEPIIATSIAVGPDHIYIIDRAGAIWFRKRLPAPAYPSATATERKKKEDEEEEEAKKMWKRFSMMGRIAGDDIPPSKDIPPEIIGVPVDLKPEEVDASSPAPFSGSSEVVEDDESPFGLCNYDRHVIRCFEE